jgi:hypothetical protein
MATGPQMVRAVCNSGQRMRRAIPPLGERRSVPAVTASPGASQL